MSVYYSEGTAPRRNDTRLKTWTKILARTQEMQAAPDERLEPRRTDSYRTIREKVNKSIRNIL